MRALSTALAASTTARAFAMCRAPSLKYSTPVALPFAPVTTRAAKALLISCIRPVASAMGSSDVVVWKAAPMAQPRPQGLALKQAWRGATG